MQGLSEFNTDQARWMQPRTGQRLYELWADGALVGTLSFRSCCGTLATAEFADGRWTFKRVGFMNPRVTVREAGAEDDLMIYQPRLWGDGVLTLPDGRSVAWRPTNFWQTAWAFVDNQHASLVSTTRGVPDEKLTDMFKTQITVQLSPRVTQDHLTVLVPLAMYLLILQQEDAAAAVAASVG